MLEDNVEQWEEYFIIKEHPVGFRDRYGNWMELQDSVQTCPRGEKEENEQEAIVDFLCHFFKDD